MNFDRLQQALYEHGLAAIPRIRSHRPSDFFYSFAFYTGGEFSYAFLTASSEEGLEEVVAEYRQQPHYAQQDPAQLRTSLKWSPCDSPLHAFCEEGAGELDGIMNELSEAFPDVDDEEAFCDFVGRVEEAFLGALKQLDKEGRFAAPTERAQLVLNLLMGDQSDEERTRLAAELNPPEVVARFTKELSAIIYE
jgi:hypothetical protein